MRKKNQEFIQYRPLLISMSYRMTGSFAEAEEIVQEVGLEWFNSKSEKIRNKKAWLVKVCTNKCIDLLRKSYKKREVYPGTWLPEVMPDSLIYWECEVEKKESLRTSFLILLENLAPKERAIYILKEVFEYSFSEISSFTQIREDTCRKKFQRAKEKIEKQERKFDQPTEKSFNLLKKLFDCSTRGNEEGIRELLHSDSEFWSDGGGKVSAASKIFRRVNMISRFFANVFKSFSNDENSYVYEYISINNGPGVVISRKNERGLWSLETLFTFEFKEGKIARIYAQRNPDKLNSSHLYLKSPE